MHLNIIPFNYITSNQYQFVGMSEHFKKYLPCFKMIKDELKTHIIQHLKNSI
jgi:hypothetical protein